LDLHLTDAVATADEREAVDGLLGPPKSGWEGGRRDAGSTVRVARGGKAGRDRRHLLLPALHAVQRRAGWISPGALNYVSLRLSVPPADAYGVASFYALFSMKPRARAVLHACDDIACRINGSDRVVERLEGALGPEGEADATGNRTWIRSPCLGMCEAAPALLLQQASERPFDVTIAPASNGALDPFLSPGAGTWTGNGFSPSAAPQTESESGRAPLRLLRRIGAVDPTSLDSYRAYGGYEALRQAIALGPSGVIREVKDAKLMGRGGAAFPTGVKWEAVAQQPVRPHYFICNADESEPGTFKDRVVMENDPFAVIETMTIAGFATSSEHGYLYIRGEYPQAHAMLEGAIEQARRHGFLGPNVLGHGFAFDIELRRGAGAYICGEETALFNSIEGKRGEPRNKPPFPVTHGLFGKPTGINNVETLINVLEILRIGGPAYAQIGTPDSTGPRLFCLSGHVERPGLYEVDFGATLGEVLDLAGGVRGAKALQAVLLGGAAGAFVGPNALDLPLTFEATRAAGVTLGSGVIMAFDETVTLPDVLTRIARFFRDESCGQCVPCRVGTVRQEELLARLGNGQPRGSNEEEIALLNDIAQAMRDASICGLGQTAASAIQSAIRTFDLFPVNDGRAASGTVVATEEKGS
jgi:NADH-quinone oxidoreductase subunit F